MAYPWEKDFWTGEKSGLDMWDIATLGGTEVSNQLGVKSTNPFSQWGEIAGNIGSGAKGMYEDVSGRTASDAARQSARTMAEAEQNKLDFIQQIYEQSRADQLPYMQSGRQYLDILNQEMGLTPQQPQGLGSNFAQVWANQNPQSGVRYTGLGSDGKSQPGKPAGVVHENEMVIESPLVKKLGGAGMARKQIEGLGKRPSTMGFQSGTGGYTAGELQNQPRQSFWQQGAKAAFDATPPGETQKDYHAKSLGISPTAANVAPVGYQGTPVQANQPRQSFWQSGAQAAAGEYGNPVAQNPISSNQNAGLGQLRGAASQNPFEAKRKAGAMMTGIQNLGKDQYRMDPASFDASKYERPDFSFTANDFQSSPYYEFLQKEGATNINRGRAAVGGLGTGGTLMALQQRGQDIAGREFGNQFNRALAGYNTNLGRSMGDRAFDYSDFLGEYGREKGEKTDRYNRLANMAGMGQTTASGLGTLGGQYGSQYGAGLSNIGAALAGGQVGAANAQAQGTQNLLNLLFSGGSLLAGGM